MADKPTYNDDIGLPDTHYNPLQNYTNVTYNTRLTMMPAPEQTKDRMSRSYDSNNGIIMWDTGGSGAIYLEELTIETVGTGNATGNYAMQSFHKFQGKLVEPLGGRFIEAISVAAMTLGYSNNNALFLLEISFKGYDSGDLPVACKGWDDEELIFRWYVNILQLKMSLNYQASTYDFELCTSDASAQLSDHNNLEQGFRMAGYPSTIGDFCKQLAEALNKREEANVKSGIRCYPHKYVITAHKEISNLKYDHGFVSYLSHLWGMRKGEVQVEAGTTIQSFVLGSMPNSQEVLKFLHRIPEKKEYNSPDTKEKTSHLPAKNFSIISGSKAVEKDNKPLFDNKLGSIVEEVHYFITTKEDAKNIISPVEYEDAQDPAQRDKRVDNWIQKGLLRKVYKWIYTGENTEVINADIKIDNLWRSVRPLWIDSETGKPIAQTASSKTTKQQPAGKSNSKEKKCEEARKVNPSNASEKQNYSDDQSDRTGSASDISPKKGWYPHMPKYYHMNTSVDQQSQQGSVYQESAQEYSIYRQIGNNQGTGGSDMFTMNLEVVGDPYWLMQIPGKPGTPPWQEDVWEYEKSQLTEDQMAEKRKKTSSHNWLPFIYFEAIAPASAWTGDDLMALRKADAVTGIYSSKKVVNKFNKGKFTTSLECVRDQLSNPWSKKAGNASHSPAAGQGTAAGKGPSNAGPSPSANASNTRASQDYPANPSNNVPPRPADSNNWKGQQTWDSKYASGWNADGTSKKKGS